MKLLIFSVLSVYDCHASPKDIDMVYDKWVHVHCYGILLHAWNVRCFGKLASVKGRLFKIDKCTINKLRLDYAPILITTKMAGEINEV